MPPAGDSHPLDSRAARVAALGLFAAMLTLLAYIHRDDLFAGPTIEAEAPDAAYAACVADRYADIDRMIADGVVGADMAALFKSRAEALCRATSAN